VSGESDAFLSSLNDQRRHVLGILDGLPDEALRRPVLPSGWTCLGMVQHLAVSVERFWFRGIVAGEPLDPPISEDSAPVWQVKPTVRAATVLDLYRREIELADAVIAGTELDRPPVAWPEEMWPDWRMRDLRQIMLHVITETACHAGHLDAVRELIDGRTWMA
jgi:uncharacterized damage-inducible protein DinB